jgi:hypothetical protein
LHAREHRLLDDGIVDTYVSIVAGQAIGTPDARRLDAHPNTNV